MLYNSLTLIVAGLYFLALGISVHIFAPLLSLSLRVLTIFFALLGLLVVLFSNRVRLKMKRLVSRHFRRPQYDYRRVWTDFTIRTAALVEEKALCEVVVKMISEMFDFLAVSIWLSGATYKQLRCGASTALSADQTCNLSELQNEAPNIMRRLSNPTRILDMEDPQITGSAGFTHAQMDLLCRARIRYVFPLEACADLMGFISLGNRVKNQPLSFEEREMLQTIADQVAANFLNLKLSEHLGQAKKMEAFQAVSAFFVHDLKNLAAKLSLILKNLPVHFDNPEFRNDTLRLISQSVNQVDCLCSRLSSLREKMEIRPVQTDLNSVVAATLTHGNGLAIGCLAKKLRPIPRVYADPGQIRKVLDNLIINAGDAVGNDGEILVTTGTRDGWVEIAVRDTGCGISKEFMDQCLFRPFKTTKKQGTGIGLFQCKQIVEAHNGIIEVESQEGQGSTFRVLLPAMQD
jgi:putative PEP-CTERM system histidine kinase